MTAETSPQSEARERVLNAAYHLFLQNGLTDVSMQQIGDAAGITKATLYHHFRDKQDLYLATMQLAITRNERALTESLSGSTDLHSLVREIVGYIFGDTRADLQRLATDFKLHVARETQASFWSQYQRPWHLVETACASLDSIDQADVAFISRYVYGAVSGLSQLHRFDEESQPITDDMLDRLAESIVFGISPDQ